MTESYRTLYRYYEHREDAHSTGWWVKLSTGAFIHIVGVHLKEQTCIANMRVIQWTTVDGEEIWPTTRDGAKTL